MKKPFYLFLKNIQGIVTSQHCYDFYVAPRSQRRADLQSSLIFFREKVEEWLQSLVKGKETLKEQH